MTEPLLYGYYRSTAAYRVRIALHYKGIAAEHRFVNLRMGKQRTELYRSRNPACLVPVWEDPDGFTLSQSLAIIDYLEEIYPHPALLPAEPRLRAYAREIAMTIACDIHPIGNLRVLDKLTADYGADADARAAWNRHWIAIGFDAIEARIAQVGGKHCIGDVPTLADLCLVPQLYNARRFELELTAYPRIVAADAAARAIPAFAAAAPEQQFDAEKG